MATAAAAAAAVHPSPPALLPRRTVAWLVCIHLAWAAADAVICLFLASFWLLYWGLTTMEVGRLACGEGCAVVTVAYKVVHVAAVATVVLIFPFIMLLMLLVTRALQAAATDIEATKEPAPKTSAYVALRQMLCDPVLLGVLAALAFTLLMPIGDLVKGDSPVTGSRRERMGSVIYDVGALGSDMVYCFVLCPIMTVRIWKAWSMTRASRKAQYAL